MQTDDEASLTLSKWPFYLGDVLLVATALAIAILGNWQLTDMQVISCVLAVALGAAIFVLPFVVEYMMRVREEADDRSSEMALLESHLQKAESALLQFHQQMKELKPDSGSFDQRYELLASTLEHKLHVESQGLTILAQQVAVLERMKSDQVELIAELKAQLDALSAAIQKEPTLPPEYSGLQASLAAMEARVAETVEPIVAMEARLEALEQSAKVVAEEPRSTRIPRQRLKPKNAGLLHRAIEEKQDSASSAVSRIIDSKSKLVVPQHDAVSVKAEDAEPEEVALDEEEDVPVVEQAEAAELEGHAEAEESEAIELAEEEPEEQEAVDDAVVDGLVVELDEGSESSGFDDLPDNIEVSLGADLIEDDELLEASAAENVVSDREVAAAEALLKEVDRPKPTRIRTKENDSIFTVSILIGIGNKPYLRGSAGGLNWEFGVPMDFEEIGKWRWVAPVDLKEPVELQVYRNDEDADRKGRYLLAPGQKLEVTPVF